ncbi:MAG: hypothetical protein FD118_4259, partial [Rhodocyclaceae bacterium]
MQKGVQRMEGPPVATQPREPRTRQEHRNADAAAAAARAQTASVTVSHTSQVATPGLETPGHQHSEADYGRLPAPPTLASAAGIQRARSIAGATPASMPLPASTAGPAMLPGPSVNVITAYPLPVLTMHSHASPAAHLASTQQPISAAAALPPLSVGTQHVRCTSRETVVSGDEQYATPPGANLI